MNKRLRELLATAAAKKVATVVVIVGLGALGLHVDPAVSDALAQLIIGAISLW
jgi:hypothetical protein